jgi:hypothetical protein
LVKPFVRAWQASGKQRELGSSGGTPSTGGTLKARAPTFFPRAARVSSGVLPRLLRVSGQGTSRVLSDATVRQRQLAGLKHGAQSDTALAPLVVSMKKALLARMRLRQRDLSWAGRELIDSYCRAKSKVVCIDRWLEANAMILPDGTSAGVMKLYFVALNSSTRLLGELREVIAAMAREDGRFDKALAALAAEGARTKALRDG